MSDRVSIFLLPLRGVSVALGAGSAVVHAYGSYLTASRVQWVIRVELEGGDIFAIADNKGRERIFTSLDTAIIQVCEAVFIDELKMVVTMSGLPELSIPTDVTKYYAAKGKRLTAALAAATSASGAAAAQLAEIAQFIDDGAAYVARSVELQARVNSLNADIAEINNQLAALPAGWDAGSGGGGGPPPVLGGG